MRFIYFLTAVFLLGSCTSTQPVREQISVDLRAPKYIIGTVEAQFDQTLSFGDLRKGEIQVHYHPADDFVSIQYRVGLIHYYYLYWDKPNRDFFINVLKQYQEEFNQRTLIRRNSRTKREYGVVQGFLVWETTKFTTPGHSYPNVEIGYYFKKGSPFFSISKMEARNVNRRSSGELKSNSKSTVYFTRAQANELAVLFDQNFLQGLVFDDFDAEAIEDFDNSIIDIDVY